MTKKHSLPNFSQMLLASFVAKGDEISAEKFPELSASAMSFFPFVLRPTMLKAAEYVYIALEEELGANPDTCIDDEAGPLTRGEKFTVEGVIELWNSLWEAGHLRHEIFRNEFSLPPELSWLQHYCGHNIYLLPQRNFPRYYAYALLFHLLPRRTLERFGLPPLRHAEWPPLSTFPWHLHFLPRDFDARLARAFTYHIWPLLTSGSPPSAFSDLEPIRLLAHNLDFWLPYAIRVTEARMRTLGRVAVENEEWIKLHDSLRNLPPYVEIDQPLMRGPIWTGEEESWTATQEIVEEADADGRLREILDAVRSHRVEEDFSPRWSFAREDFERKLYRKRSKIKVSFVELDDTIPVHGPDSEVHGNLLWEDFLALLDTKEREVVVVIRSGVTRVGEIGKLLGYANHSPVSKALKRIRHKASQLLE